MCLCMCMCMYVCMHACMHVCVYIYIYISYNDTGPDPGLEDVRDCKFAFGFCSGPRLHLMLGKGLRALGFRV